MEQKVPPGINPPQNFLKRVVWFFILLQGDEQNRHPSSILFLAVFRYLASFSMPMTFKAP